MGTCIVPVQPWEETVISGFLGPWARPEVTDLPPNRGLLALNTEYYSLEPGTRAGFGPLVNTNKIITSLFNWIKAADDVSPVGNYLLLYNATDGEVEFIVNMASPFFTILFAVTCDSIDACSNGNQLFVASINVSAQSTPVGAAQVRIVGIYGAAINTDIGFLGPLTTKPTLSNTGSGSVTAGSHFVGYVITTRNGFTGLISPVVSGTSTPDQTSAITAPGAQTIQVSLTATWPAEANLVQFVMTATTNPFQYFTIPGALYAVPGGASFTVNANINISDQQLIANTNDVTNNQFFLTQNSLGAGPFNPFKVVIYGSRSMYLTYDTESTFAIYGSEPNNAQQLTEQFHELRLPGFQMGCSAFSLGGIFYVVGPNWTYSFQDNGQQPVAWPTPTLIDGRIGSACVEGVTVTASGNWAAVVHTSGLYVMSGYYQDKPISYYNDPEWRRINWAAQQTIRIVDNHDKKVLALAVPLDDSTVPNYIMTWDYSQSQGGTPDYASVSYSLWNLSGYNPRAMCLYQNYTTTRLEFLLGPSIANYLLRQMNTTDDANPWTDNGAAINWQYQTAPQPQGSLGVVNAYPGAYVRARGMGAANLGVTSDTLDNAASVKWSKPIILSPAPGVEYWRQFYVRSEQMSMLFQAGTNAGDWAILAGIRLKYYQWAARR